MEDRSSIEERFTAVDVVLLIMFIEALVCLLENRRSRIKPT